MSILENKLRQQALESDYAIGVVAMARLRSGILKDFEAKTRPRGGRMSFTGGIVQYSQRPQDGTMW